MDRLNPPEPLSLSGNVGVAWKKWRQRFHIYMVASGLDRQPVEVKTSVLLHCMILSEQMHWMCTIRFPLLRKCPKKN